MSKIIAIFALALSGAILILFVMSSAFAASLETSANATYKLYENGTGMCSAQHVKNIDEGALFLTAAHCVDNDKADYSIRLENRGTSPGPIADRAFEVTDERVFHVRVLRSDEKTDVAIFVTKSKTAGAELGDPIDIASVDEANTVKFGDDVVVLGFPAAEEKTITKGQFTGKINGILGLQFNYQTNVPVAGGNSGGGLYAKFGDSWKLIGTTSATRRDNSIMTYFSVSEAVWDALAGYVNKERPAPKTPDTGAVDER